MKLRFYGWCTGLLLMTAAAGAQRFRIVTAGLQAEPPRPSMIAAPAPEEGHIGLDVVVTDKGGKPISGLELKDFSLFDNNQPVKVLSFQAVDSAQVIILLDAVNLGYLALAQTRDEVAKFLRRNGGHLAQPVSVVLLNNTGLEVLMQASTDGNALAAELDKAKGTFRTIGNSGGISGASERFNLCIKWLAVIANGEREDPGRKLLIWTGPGYPKLDMASVNTSPKGVRLLFDNIVDLSTILRESNVVLYNASLGVMDTDIYESFLKPVTIPDRAQSANLDLKVLAIQSGGLVFDPDNDLAAQIAKCVQDGSSYYRHSFDSPRTNPAQEYHDLKVTIDMPKVKARSSTGYYNEP